MALKPLAGYLHDDLEHHIDHLAPFCSLMKCPLIVTDERIARICKLYYPDLHLIFITPMEAPMKIAKTYQVIVTTLPRPLFDDIFFLAQLEARRVIETLWLPHGNSDKGYHSCAMQHLRHEKTLLVYGSKMVDFITSQQGLSKGSCVLPIGNFRYRYFLKHQVFYLKLLKQMDLDRRFILYAPTWNDHEKGSSFEEMADRLVSLLSSSPFHVVIKPHPNESKKAHLSEKKQLHSSRVTWLYSFPPIYPLLDRTTHLIGDTSSIGYDFLTFNRPMFFFKQPYITPLQKHGTLICSDTFFRLMPLFQQTQDQKTVSIARQKLYQYTFGRTEPWKKVRSRIFQRVKRLDTS